MNVEIRPVNPCAAEKNFCVNCHSHFMTLRPNIRSVLILSHFLKDFEHEQEAKSVVEDVLNCANTDFNELHKFEENLNGVMVFRAKKKGVHIVYVIDKSLRLIFLRAFRNYSDYSRFLSDKQRIMKMSQVK